PHSMAPWKRFVFLNFFWNFEVGALLLMQGTHKAIYASRGIHSILRVLYYPLPCFQADKSTAGLKATGQAHIAGTLCVMLREKSYIRSQKDKNNK
ncbi:hypothetical protein, partial [Marinilabilia salmonicolor]|uniref:hypothetical protein n=1 Tax=Marinilabilia salmonicolor TaxID=989 RepID=UPI001C6A7487